MEWWNNFITFLGGKKKKRQREAAASRDFIIARLEGNLKALDK